MKKNLQQIIDAFLKKYKVVEKPILLAFSGGPDSLALLHLMLDFQRRNPFKLALAHVDHGWRPESTQEAEANARLAHEFGLPFHLKKLAPQASMSNLEAVWRQERLQFFASLCSTYGYHGVLLAHHADDLAETTLKRTLEGAALPFLGGLRPESEWQGIKLWRPLLGVSKAHLKEWLAQRDLEGFYDKSNDDRQFLRGRLRTCIFPMLTGEFGKQVNQGLWRIGMEAAELREYLDEQIAPFQKRMVHSPMGIFLDLSQDAPKALLELKHLVRKGCELQGFTLSHVHVHTVAQLLADKVPDKRVLMGTKKIYIDRGCLFICADDFQPLPEETISLHVGQAVKVGPWVVETHPLPSSALSESTNWRHLWGGGGQVILPYDEYALAAPKLSMPYPRSLPLRKWWTDHKVPAFMRGYVPILWGKNRVYHEFLTGKIDPSLKENGSEKLLIKIKPLNKL